MTYYARIIKLGKAINKKLNYGKTVITAMGVWTRTCAAVIDQISSVKFTFLQPPTRL